MIFFSTIEGCFDIVAGLGNKVKHVQFVSTLSKGRNFTIILFNIVAVFGNKVERCFDIVADVDGR